MVELLQELCALPGVSGHEDAVRDYIRDKAAPYAGSMHTDRLGNLIVIPKGGRDAAARAVILDAAMDETGVIISDYTQDGSLRFQCVGTVDRRQLIGKRVYLGRERILGVFGMKPIHLTTKEERTRVPKERELYIDIGCRKRDEAKRRVPLGTVGVFDDDCGPFGAGLFRGKALYSRVGCAVLLKLLEEAPGADCTFVFSVQREVGARGAFGAAFARSPEPEGHDGCAISLDGCAAWDFPGADGPSRGAQVGKGVVLAPYGAHAAFHRGLFEQLRGEAQQSGISWQVQEGTEGNRNAAIYGRQAAGRAAASLAVPVRYRGAPMGVVSLGDCQAMLDLLRAQGSHLGYSVKG